MERRVAMKVRKFVTIIEETCMEGGKEISPSHRKVASIAVVKNPSAGKYVEKLDELIDIGAKMGTELTQRAIRKGDHPICEKGSRCRGIDRRPAPL
jgi:hypothetical protein